MPSTKQRGSQVIYVAASVREFPEDVQDWLSQVDNPAGASADPYDTLALLARGARPAVIFVSIESIDWNELDFFDLAARLSPQTEIFVVGHDHHAAKIDAACQRGARVFDPEAVAEARDRPVRLPVPLGPAGLLAGSLRSAFPTPPSADRVVAAPPPRDDRPPTKPSKEPEEAPADSPGIRLVLESEEAQQEQTTIPFPWAPSHDRPKRTPPASQTVPEARARPEPAAAGPAPPEARTYRPTQPVPVELTPEELAALMGKPIPPDAGAKQEQCSP